MVKDDTHDYALMLGVPAKQVGWMSEYGERLNLPLVGNGTMICEHTGHKYELKNNVIVRVV